MWYTENLIKPSFIIRHPLFPGRPTLTIIGVGFLTRFTYSAIFKRLYIYIHTPLLELYIYLYIWLGLHRIQKGKYIVTKGNVQIRGIEALTLTSPSGIYTGKQTKHDQSGCYCKSCYCKSCCICVTPRIVK